MSGALNLEWAAALIDELVRGGVRWFMIAPGSRSTPLVLAASRHPDAQTVVHLDERSAAFFALGIGKATGAPAAVITTSGTATANLYPAVVEAAQSESPLIAITADRPARLLGGDANQAIDQRHLYGDYPKETFELGAASAARDELAQVRQVGARAAGSAGAVPQGPVHINVPFAKPLEPKPRTPVAPASVQGRPGGGSFTQILSGPGTATAEAITSVVRILSRAKRPMIVAGPASGATTCGLAARTLASQWRIPLIADPLSGARFEPVGPAEPVIDHADLILGDPDLASALQPDVVVRFGRSPTSPRVVDLCARVSEAGGSVIVFDAGGRWKDHRAAVTHLVLGDPGPSIEALLVRLAMPPKLDVEWAQRCFEVRDAVRLEVASTLQGEPFEGLIAAAAARAIPKLGLLFVSSSMPIRDVDAFVGTNDFTGGALGNRGASGIDGITSTALGAALGSGRPLLCLIGDVAFIHDLGGLLATRSVTTPVVFVVVNNDGGAIFHMLPIREHEPEFTEYFATPHGLDFSHAAALYGLPYTTIPGEGLEDAAREAFATGGIHILEVTSDRGRTTELRQAATQRIQDAARNGLTSISNDAT